MESLHSISNYSIAQSRWRSENTILRNQKISVMLNYMISLKIKLIVNGNSVNDEVTNK